MKKMFFNRGMKSVLLCCAAALVSFSASAKDIQVVQKHQIISKDGSALLKCVADTYISGYPLGNITLTDKNSEQGTNAGTTKRLKIKKNENIPLLKFDFSKIPVGATITSATIAIKMHDNKPLNHVGVWSVHTDWNEGKGTWDDGGKVDLNHNGACFIGPKGIKSSWRNKGNGAFFANFSGAGGDATSVSRAVKKENGIRHIAVDPLVIYAAIENGQTLALSDETGVFDGDLSNAFFSSRETKDAPTLHVTWAKGNDSVAPALSGDIVVSEGALPGTLIVDFPVAGDNGLEGVAVGYNLWIDGTQIEKIYIPRPKRSSRKAYIEGLPPGKKVTIKVQAYDKAGNTCERSATGVVSAEKKGVLAKALVTTAKVQAPTVAKSFDLFMVDGVTLIDPSTGALAAKQKRSEGIQSNRTFIAVKGETIGAQCIVVKKTDELKNISISFSDLKTKDGAVIASSQIETFKEYYVKMKKNWVADILPVLKKGEKLSFPSQKNIKNQKALGIYIDILIPKTTKPGVYYAEVTVSTDNEKSIMPFSVEVVDITLPDELTFTVEMNAYAHSKNKKIFHETYRVCHKNRLSYNVLGYGHSTRNKYGPILNIDSDESVAQKDIKIVDWTEYDAFYGPLFSGEIAKDLPRAGQPATHWYLMLHDAWPGRLSRNIPSLWEGRVSPQKDKKGFVKWRNNLALNSPLIEDHFTDDWKTAGINVVAQLSKHFEEKGWTQTKMQIFNNSKNYMLGGSRSLWVMDEPQYVSDYRALAWMYRFFADAFQGSKMNIEIRGDISRPQFMGDVMDKALGSMVISSALETYKKYVQEFISKEKVGLWWYGGGGDADADPSSTIALFINKWSLGCDGGMPVFTTFSGPNSWDKTGSLRVVRFDEKTGMPVESMRSKSYRVGQQYIELINMLAAKKDFTRWHLAELLQKEMPLKITTFSTGADDPGYSTFEGLDSSKLELMRSKIIASISAKN